MPRGRMPGTGHKLELPPVPLLAPTCVYHANSPRGGEPTPNALLQIQYVCLLEGVGQDASGHIDVCQGVGAETQAAEGRGSVGEHSGGLQYLQETLVDGDSI